MKKKAKFFCDFCGTEVAQHDKICKKCGKFFSSVKCPACGHTGGSGIFTNGCPKCGYAVSIQPKQQSLVKDSKKHSDDPLPIWIYVLCTIVLGAIIFAVFNYY